MSTDLPTTVFAFVQSYIATHQRAPSIREIAAGCFMGKSTILRALDILEARGQIARVPGQARSITLTETTLETIP